MTTDTRNGHLQTVPNRLTDLEQLHRANNQLHGQVVDLLAENANLVHENERLIRLLQNPPVPVYSAGESRRQTIFNWAALGLCYALAFAGVFLATWIIRRGGL